MDCEQAKEALSAWMDAGSAGSGGEPPALRAHLASCPACRAFQHDYATLDGELAAFYASGPAVVLPRAADYRRPQRIRRVFVFAAAAAAIMLIATSAIFWSKFHRQRAPTEIAVTGPKPVEIFVAAGTQLLKRDGWSVWLRDGTKLKETSARNVEFLGGAAYFAVVPGGGAFSVKTAHGSVAVIGTEFSVTTERRPDQPDFDYAAHVAVRNGTVKLENEKGTLTLNAGDAGHFPPAKGETPGPEPFPNLSVAGDTNWRPWSGLDATERQERIAWLKLTLSDEDYQQRVGARDVLREAGGDAWPLAEQWIAAESPRLRLESVLFLKNAANGDVAARKALQTVLENGGETSALREQAAASLGAIGIEEDLALLDRLRQDREMVNDTLRRAAAAAAAAIRDRLNKN